MTAIVPSVGVVPRKAKWKQLGLPEIPATRFSCLSSVSFRPKLGFAILSLVLIGSFVLLVLPFVSPSINPFSHKYPEKFQRKSINSNCNLIMSSHTPSSVKSVTLANNKLSRKIYGQLASVDRGTNFIVSPFSVGQVLAMTWIGAAGSTESEIRAGLHLPEEDDEAVLKGLSEILNVIQDCGRENVTLESANRLFVHSSYTLMESFLCKNQEYFSAEPTSTDFSESNKAKTEINSWVEEKTRNKIKDLIPDGVLNALTRLVLVNAVYFKGDWADKFKVSETREDDFTLDDGNIVRVEMMRKMSKYKIKYLQEMKATALNMPYLGNKLSMVLVLPDQGSKLADLETKIENEWDPTALSFDSTSEGRVFVALPKFKLESSHNLNNVLQNLGLKEMFIGGKADFSGMTGNRELSVSKIMQKAFIEVNEEGSEAAAATGSVMLMRAAPLHSEFICNRPFTFFIQEVSTGIILFTGRVTNPSVGATV